ncbi:MAG TPA: hypothetical protein VGC87_17265 [Pyrinomonadaceae bacterium]|jgi:hypothetical protein
MVEAEVGAGVENFPGDEGAREREPRWPAALAIVALAGLYSVMPEPLLPGGSRWVLPSAVAALLVPTVISYRKGNRELNEVLGYILNGFVTVALVWSLAGLIGELLAHRGTPQRLLLSASALWLANILVFSSWYWRLDAGGPHERDLTAGHSDGAFLFPQMTMHPEAKLAAGEHDWSPHFVDYLFLAFNTSTAFSPTDVPVLSRWAKVLMMLQSLISLTVIALLAARAVNLL